MAKSVHDVRLERGLPCLFNHGTSNPGCICDLATKINAALEPLVWEPFLVAAGEPSEDAWDIRIGKICYKKNQTKTNKEDDSPEARIEFEAGDALARVNAAINAGSVMYTTLGTADKLLKIEADKLRKPPINPPTLFNLSASKKISHIFQGIVHRAKALIEALEDDGHMKRVVKSALADLAEEEEMDDADFRMFAKRQKR